MKNIVDFDLEGKKVILRCDKCGGYTIIKESTYDVVNK